MIARFEICPLNNKYCDQILDLILPIQQIEFNVPVTLEGQPDLLDIETSYHKTGGGFWGAVCQGELLGTIALISIGKQSGAIRKMFVKKEFRGKDLGVAQQLFSNLVRHCEVNNINQLYLGTVDILKAAHRFYERNGFHRVNKELLPANFPVMMGENVYYSLKFKNIYCQKRNKMSKKKIISFSYTYFTTSCLQSTKYCKETWFERYLSVYDWY